MKKRHLTQDALILIASIVGAIVLAETALIDALVSGIPAYASLKSFVAGLFFTSAFTTAPAIVILGKLAADGLHPLQVALFGALGAVCGDYLIFSFVRDRLGEDLTYLFSRKSFPKLRHFFRTRAFRWISPFAAILIIASPLPDELGIALLGFSRTKTALFLPVSFLANFLGILAIGLIGKALI